MLPNAAPPYGNLTPPATPPPNETAEQHDTASSSQTPSLPPPAPRPQFATLNSTSTSKEAPPPPYSRHAPPITSPTTLTRRDPNRNTHYLRPEDTIYTLALAYGTSAKRLLSFNALSDPALLHSRVALDIPPECPRRSISDSMPGDQEARERNVKLLRLMQAQKLRRDLARVYLEQAGWDLDEALKKCKADDRWEAAHPMGKHKGAGGGTMRAGDGDLTPLRMAKLLK